MRVSIGDISCARSLRNFRGMESSPVALFGLMLVSSLNTPGAVMLISGTVVCGLSPFQGISSVVSLENTEVNRSIRILALVLLSLNSTQFLLRGATAELSALLPCLLLI
jgi:hypothetical protein